MKLYQWIRKSFQILMLSIIIINVNNCWNKPKTDDTWTKGFWLSWLNLAYYYNNCPPVNAVLDTGTHNVTLVDGQEYWFDITAKGDLSKAETSYYTFSIYIKYEPISDLFYFAGNCMVNNVLFSPKSIFSPNDQINLSPDAQGFYLIDGTYPPNSTASNALVGIKVKNPIGPILIKAP